MNNMNLGKKISEKMKENDEKYFSNINHILFSYTQITNNIKQ